MIPDSPLGSPACLLASGAAAMDSLSEGSCCEMEVSSGFSGLSEVAQQYLPWIFGSLTHQQLILIACGAQFTVPSGWTVLSPMVTSVFTRSV